MDVNQFYRELFEDTLGLDVLGLESEFPDLVRLVETKTILALGNYLFVQYPIVFNLSDHSRIVPKDHPARGLEYYLSDPILDKYNLPILDVLSVNYCNSSSVDPYDPDQAAYWSAFMASRNNFTLESVMFGSEFTYNTTITDFAVPYKRYHELRGSRILYMENWAANGDVEVIVKTRYPNLVSIPEEYRETVMILAEYDVKIKLWNELKYLEDVVTPAGNLNLKINEWESADRDRKDFLKDLKVRSLPDRVASKYFRIV